MNDLVEDLKRRAKACRDAYEYAADLVRQRAELLGLR